MRQQFLYYQLLKYSGHGTTVGDALDRSVDRLCASQTTELADVPIAVRLSGLKQLSQASLGRIPMEILQRLLEVSRAIQKGLTDCSGTEIATSLLGRALEAAGVAYGIRQFSKQYEPFLQSRLYKTQGLNYLLANHGPQAVAGVAQNIDSFTVHYVNHTKHLYGKMLALAAMKTSNVDAYRIFSHKANERWRRQRVKDTAGTRSSSMCLDSKGEVYQPTSFLPGRRSYSLDVRAGTDKMLEEVSA